MRQCKYFTKNTCQVFYFLKINDCEEGFFYDSDWKRCTDVDECESENSICEQECANTEGLFFKKLLSYQNRAFGIQIIF